MSAGLWAWRRYARRATDRAVRRRLSRKRTTRLRRDGKATEVSERRHGQPVFHVRRLQAATICMYTYLVVAGVAVRSVWTSQRHTASRHSRCGATAPQRMCANTEKSKKPPGPDRGAGGFERDLPPGWAWPLRGARPSHQCTRGTGSARPPGASPSGEAAQPLRGAYGYSPRISRAWRMRWQATMKVAGGRVTLCS